MKSAPIVLTFSALLFVGWICHRWASSPAAPPAEDARPPDVSAHVPASAGASSASPRDTVPAAGGFDRSALESLFEAASQNSNDEDRRMVLRALGEFLARHDLARARDYITRLLQLRKGGTDGDAVALTQAFAEASAAKNPARTVEWAEELPMALKLIIYQSVARHWVDSDPIAATQWLFAVKSPALRESVIRVMSQQLQQHPRDEFAWGWAVSLAQSQDGPRCSDVVGQHWSRRDPDAAWQWTRVLPDPEDRNRGMIAVITSVAEQNPTQALEWAATLPVGESRDRAQEAAVIRWGATDPAAAAAWIDRSATPAFAQVGALALAVPWLRKDPAAASAWLERAGISAQSLDYLKLRVGPDSP